MEFAHSFIHNVLIIIRSRHGSLQQVPTSCVPVHMKYIQTSLDSSATKTLCRIQNSEKIV